MKRCPTCNQQFTDEWLTFCTQDGTSLVEMPASPNDPPATVLYPSLPPTVSPSEQPTMDYPDAYQPPALQPVGQQPLQGGWAPPPPPAYASQPQQNTAVLSLVLAIASIPLGFCCYVGLLISPVAIGLGIFSLIKIKQDPTKWGGKGMAIAGIVIGSLYLVVAALWILIWSLAMVSGAG